MKLEAVPTFISVLGLFDVEYRRDSGREIELLVTGGGGWKVHHGGQDNGCLQRWEHLHRQKWTGEDPQLRDGFDGKMIRWKL